ncbi:hypothetical protein ACVWW5_000607 [Bradyrhizobium sp. LM3.4]
MPDRAVAALVVDMLDAAAEIDVIDHFRPLQFPGVAEAEPFVRIFLLPTLIDDLAEQAVIITDAVSDRGDRQRRHAFHEAGGEAAEAAIAERGVRLAFAQLRQRYAEITERDLEDLEKPHVVERVGEETADQKFEREIIDALAPGIVAAFLRAEPAMHDTVAQRQRRGLVPVVPGRHAGVLADGEAQLRQDRALDLSQCEFVDGLAGCGCGKIGLER